MKRGSNPRGAATDPEQPVRLTDGRSNAQHLYFTGATLTADDRRLVFLGDAQRPARGPYDPDAAVNVFVLNRRDGHVAQLSDNRGGVLRAYVYFGGHVERGIGPGSVALHAPSGTVLYLQDRTIHRTDVAGTSPAELAELPAGLVTGYGAVSDDGTRYAIPAIDAAAFADLHAIDRTVRRFGLATRIFVFDTRSGVQLDEVAVPSGWVTHVQFRPNDCGTILFNHEWAEGAGVRRLWIADADGLRALRRDAGDDQPPAGPDDDVDHEIWSRDGESVVYHGRYAATAPRLAGRAFIGSIDLASGSAREIPMPTGFERYGHFATGPGDRLVTDGYWHAADDGPPGSRMWPPRADRADAPPEDDGGEWISRVDVDWSDGSATWAPICRSGSSWSSQDAHPHPVFDHDGSAILFTSDRDGFRAVYAVPAGDTRPP